jgi:hypothetical protein
MFVSATSWSSSRLSNLYYLWNWNTAGKQRKVQLAAELLPRLRLIQEARRLNFGSEAAYPESGTSRFYSVASGKLKDNPLK